MAEGTALPALLTVAEAAKALACSEATVRRMLADGELEPVRLRSVPGAAVRVRVADVRRLAEPQGDRR